MTGSDFCLFIIILRRAEGFTGNILVCKQKPNNQSADVCLVLLYLKVLSCTEGEGVQGFLLRAPALREEGVSDEDLFLQTRVQMKSDVAAAGHSQVHSETDM